MVICGDVANKGLSENLAKLTGFELFYPDVKVFADGEKRVRFEKEVLDETVLVVKSHGIPTDSNVLETLFLLDALKRSGATKLIGIISYLGYMRADHMFRTGEAVPLEVVIGLLESNHLDEIVIIDPHSIKIPELFKITVHNLSAIHVFAKKIKELQGNNGEISIVSPDMGGIRRLDLLSEELGGVNKVIINKDRDLETGSITVRISEGEIKGTCFIVDDIISTGKTIVDSVDVLLENGAEEVYIMATHPVFAPGASKLLKNSKAKKVYVTDTIEVSEEDKFENLEVLSVADLISQVVKND